MGRTHLEALFVWMAFLRQLGAQIRQIGSVYIDRHGQIHALDWIVDRAPLNLHQQFREKWEEYQQRRKLLGDAFALAEELTRDEQSEGFVPSCRWCYSEEATSDGQRFLHFPECKWARLRALLGDEVHTRAAT